MPLRPSPRFLPILAIAAALVTAAGFTPAFAKEATVTITNFAFDPATVTIAKGDAVTFVNGDDTIHSIVADDGRFHSDGLDTGDKFTFTSSQPGTFTYHCGLHPFMTGEIVVQ